MMKNLWMSFIAVLLSTVLVACDSSSDSTPAQQNVNHSTNHVIQIETNYGVIWVELYRDLTPQTVDNFLQYVEEDFYDNTVVHQVLPGFIIQAGLFDANFEQKPTRAVISNESQFSPAHSRGTVAMMRGDHPDSATSEFFINLNDNQLFDIHNGYAVFGKVIRGMDVLDKIGAVSTCSRAPFYDDVPCETVIIKKVVEKS